MATFFRSFWTSSMPKRLLRYALSRLEMLDDETLDLENLELALGRDTVLEFHDVGIILQKLEKSLKLPPTLSIQKAKVLLLRVTVPVDLWSSPIRIEVEGVDVRLKVTSRENKQEQARRRRKSSGNDDDVVPTAEDLAQSFLATQPSSEKRRMEAALAAEAQDLGASVASSDADSDDDSTTTFGTGEALTLPAFLTDFLHGIVDRVLIRIRDVMFQMDLEVPVEMQATTPELVTFQLALEEVSVEGVTAPAMDGDAGPKIVHREGKRHVSLDNIRAFLISEANVFSSLARSPSMPSSISSHSSSGRSIAPDKGAGSRALTTPDGLARNQDTPGDSEEAFNIPYELDEEKGEQDEDARLDEPASSLSTPRASIYQDLRSAHRGISSQPAFLDMEPPPWRQASINTDLTHSTSEATLARDPSLSYPPQPESSSPASEPGATEDLAQSHLFSHDEAESMYMSAFSEAQSQSLKGMPGAWEDDAAEEASTHKAEAVAWSGQTTAGTPSGLPAGDPMLEGAPASEMDPVERPGASEHVETGGKGNDAEALSLDAQHEDTATPRGPTRLVKEILSLQSVSVYLPSHHKPHMQVPSGQPGTSMSPSLPGAFSVHSAARESPTDARPVDEPKVDKAIEIDLAPLEIRLDSSVGFLLASVIVKLADLFQAPNDLTEKASANTATRQHGEVRLAVGDLSILLLEKLTGVADTAQRHFSASRKLDLTSDVLLKAQIQKLSASVSTKGSHTDAALSIGRFKFGYANDDVLFFDRQVHMFESVMNTFPEAGEDIRIKVDMAPDKTRCHINTLPMHVKVDLQRLDETFGWFGGLSGFLSMGSSMTSNASRSLRSPVRTAQKARGVRFEAPVNPNDQSAAKENKIDMRINGFRLDLVGKECSLVLDTSALKMISRDEAIGVHFSRIRLSGPHLKNGRAEVPVVLDILDTRIEYLALPRHTDLERILELVTPSKVKFDQDNDVIIVETLLRQRKKGSVLRLTLDTIKADLTNVQMLSCLPSLGEDLAKLGTVAKYLPEDDRPGIMTLGLVKNVDCTVDIGGRFGALQASLKEVELAHITVPSLVAVAVNSVSVTRNKIERLVHTAELQASGTVQRPPVLMLRMVDDIEPVLKVKLMGLGVEYHVPAVMDILGLAEDATPQDFDASLAASVANLGDHAQHAMHQGVPMQSRSSEHAQNKSIKVDISFRDCLIGLNPLGLPSKLIVVLTDTHLEATPGDNSTASAVASLRKGSILLVDDVSLGSSDDGTTSSRRRPAAASSPQVVALCSQGYVDICQISSARATVKVTKDDAGAQHVDIQVRDDLLVLETCADSTQTMMAVANALKPPTPPSKEIKYRTEIVPVQDLLASITADAFGQAEGDYDFERDFALAHELGSEAGETGSELDFFGGNDSGHLDIDAHYFDQMAVGENLFDATASSVLSEGPMTQDTHDGVLLTSASVGNMSDDGSRGDLDIQEDFFGSESVVQGTAHRWNSAKNTYDRSNDKKVQQSPLRVCVRDVHVIWNLFDGYDWERTREVITKAVQDVEAKAHERRARASGYEQEVEDEETVIGDFLFNSIYIGIPANRDPRELTQAINQELNDNATETESVATTTVTNTTVRAGASLPQRSRTKKLKLSRSKYHKVTFELKGVNVDMVTFPADSGETLNSIDVRVKELDIFDHVPTSTWKKFAMYDQDAGEREMGASMVHLELLNVKPVPSMPATEMVLKVTLLPLRLHVDQDALDFITRFFTFKDDSVPVDTSPSDVPFIQRAEINDVAVKLDFKPKRVDYAGLRSGRTTEFMNFIVLEDAHLVLRHIILYGVSGFDRLGNELNDIWTANVKATQLPGILAGLAPIRSLVNAGSGFKDLIEIPIREYRKDGRIVRSVGKGAAAFAKTTGTEVVKLGAKLAIGTQHALQGAEVLLQRGDAGGGPSASSSSGTPVDAGRGSWDDNEDDDDDDDDADDFSPHAREAQRKQISLYADQPMGIMQGMRGAYASLARDLAVARDAIIAVPGEVMESQSAQGAARAVLRRAPTIIFRPAIGATKAIGQTLLGATNALDPQNRRRMEAKYKRH